MQGRAEEGSGKGFLCRVDEAEFIYKQYVYLLRDSKKLRLEASIEYKLLCKLSCFPLEMSLTGNRYCMYSTTGGSVLVPEVFKLCCLRALS